MFSASSIITLSPVCFYIISAIYDNLYAPNGIPIVAHIHGSFDDPALSAKLLCLYLFFLSVMLNSELKTVNLININFEGLSTGSLKLNLSVEFIILKLGVCSFLALVIDSVTLL